MKLAAAWPVVVVHRALLGAPLGPGSALVSYFAFVPGMTPLFAAAAASDEDEASLALTCCMIRLVASECRTPPSSLSGAAERFSFTWLNPAISRRVPSSGF